MGELPGNERCCLVQAVVADKTGGEQSQAQGCRAPSTRTARQRAAGHQAPEQSSLVEARRRLEARRRVCWYSPGGAGPGQAGWGMWACMQRRNKSWGRTVVSAAGSRHSGELASQPGVPRRMRAARAVAATTPGRMGPQYKDNSRSSGCCACCGQLRPCHCTAHLRAERRETCS